MWFCKAGDNYKLNVFNRNLNVSDTADSNSKYDWFKMM